MAYMMKDRLKDAAEEADKERALKDVAEATAKQKVATVKDKVTTAENTEARAQGTEKDRA